MVKGRLCQAVLVKGRGVCFAMFISGLTTILV